MSILSILETKKSLGQKVEKMISELRVIAENPQRIEDLVPFFRITTAFIDGLTDQERDLIPQKLRLFLQVTGRGEWNGTPISETTEFDHISVNPTRHFDEFYRKRTLRDLVNNPGTKNDQCGFAKRPMDDKEFYYECFVKPYMASNFRLLIASNQELN